MEPEAGVTRTYLINEDRSLPPALEPLAYEPRVLLYIDVLGWKELIAQSVEEPVLIRDLERALSVSDEARSHLSSGAIRWSVFSDHICVSAPGTLGGLGVVSTLGKRFAHLLLEGGFAVRGAIVHGPLVHRSDKIFGPALIDAYQLESTVAFYPRIIFAPSTAEMIAPARAAAQLFGWETRVDRDGVVYLDILTQLKAPDTIATCQSVRVALERRPPQKSTLNIEAKRRWLFSFIDEVEREATAPDGGPA
jgi:hypothetical protein